MTTIKTNDYKREPYRFPIKTIFTLATAALLVMTIVAISLEATKLWLQVEGAEIVDSAKEKTDSPIINDVQHIQKILRVLEIGKDLTNVFFKGCLVEKRGDPKQPDRLDWALRIQWGENAQIKTVQYGSHFRGYRLYPLV
jgi:hypothetical protein